LVLAHQQGRSVVLRNRGSCPNPDPASTTRWPAGCWCSYCEPASLWNRDTRAAARNRIGCLGALSGIR
jgi:hypothetical protein